MYVYYRARDMVVKLSLMSWMDNGYLCLVFTADATVRAGKGPGGSGVQNKFELLNILKVCVQIIVHVI